MLKVFVDSGCSIKKEEQEKYQIELIPLNILLGEKEYKDGENLSMEDFYKFLIDEKGFPKTSLPDLVEVEERVKKCLDQGDEVIILTISSKISGTYNALRLIFEGESRVKVIDSKLAVGGMRLIVDEINRNRDKSLDVIEKKVQSIILCTLKTM